MPELPGGRGVASILEHLQSHLKYPKVAPASRKDGRVFVSFIVLATGEVSGIKIVKSLAPEYDAAVIDAVQTLPRFTPGVQSNKPVAVSLTVPVQFGSPSPSSK
jgi:TonB family protein